MRKNKRKIGGKHKERRTEHAIIATGKQPDEMARVVMKEVEAAEKKSTVFSQDDFDRLEKADRDKRLVMWSGVAFFMILIVVAWIFNARNIFKRPEAENTGNEINWVKTMEEFNKTMESVKSGMSSLSSLNLPNQPLTGATTSPAAGVSRAATSTFVGATTTEPAMDIEELKTKLEELR